IRDKLVTGVQTCALPISFAGGKGQREEGGLPAGSDGAHIGFDNGIAAVKAALAEALAHLRRRIGIALQHPDNLRFEWVQFAVSRSEERRVGKECRCRGWS